MPRRAFNSYTSSLYAWIGSVVLLVAISGIATAAPGYHGPSTGFTPKNSPFKSRSPSGQLSDPRAAALFRQALEAELRLAYTGKQVTVRMRVRQELTSEQQVTRVGIKSYRIDYITPQFSGEQIIDNGKVYWHYLPGRNTLEVSPSRLSRMETRTKQLLRQLQRGLLAVAWIGQEQLAGHNCGIIEAYLARDPNPVRLRFWVDLSNGAQLKIENYGRNRQLRAASYFTEIDYAPKLRPETFNPPTTPKNVRTIDGSTDPIQPSIAAAQAQSGFTVLQPSYLPLRLRFQEVTLSSFRNHPLITLRYTNGINFLSLSETPIQIGMDNDKEIQHLRPGVAMGQQSGMRLIIVGNLGPEELEKIIRSVR